MQARLYRVHGRVQGVGFRWFVERAAQDLDLNGYVKNLHDGSVEVYATGSNDKLDELLRWLEQGPHGAYVSRVDEWPAPVRPSRGFRIEF